MQTEDCRPRVKRRLGSLVLIILCTIFRVDEGVRYISPIFCETARPDDCMKGPDRMPDQEV